MNTRKNVVRIGKITSPGLIQHLPELRNYVNDELEPFELNGLLQFFVFSFTWLWELLAFLEESGSDNTIRKALEDNSQSDNLLCFRSLPRFDAMVSL